MKVVKFGGSSLASGAQLEKVFHIVTSDPARKAVVVSAPGKRYAEDTKVTDLLIACAEQYLASGSAPELTEAVVERYALIANELQLEQSIIEKIRDDLFTLLEGDKSNPEQYLDAVKASGEDNNAKLIAAYFRHKGVKAEYINPKDAGLFVTNEPGNAQVLPESYQNLYRLRERDGLIIFPGFFGFSEAGDVITFSRSGSDITGSILANGLQADLYENFTDVDAVYAVNPSYVENPKEISELTYREMRELSYAGFSVFHDEALIPAFRAGIPVQIKNTNNPSAQGTRVVSKRDNTNGPVVGIASDTGFCSIYISKFLMNREIGFGRRALQILEEHGLTYEHVPSGIDDMTIILREGQMDAATERSVIKRIQEDLHADEVIVEHHLALIMVVGEAMRHNVGTTARAAKALSEAKVNIEMINQGSSEVSMMFGVKEAEERKAVQALYQEFFAGVLIS
ncbi:aspartate kinase [Bacillus spizizenii ATCC 6633 = JCM 2499]|uniref:Aspartokinase n=1 Tax=Bacillus spizizenii (strain ATCC 23059 / NRRL B-14472 / W23) TaxID=655816 RepID=E0U2F2_BACSH|nr:aspartate kinase [Bacillus spizizenii]MDU7576493.1 aspartate kinase [Bacillus subtilis]ADM36450.1 aspartate kinase [Bacillus spizizenii str. W23]AJW85901.1 aspartate kinase [Bacillus spizizenii]EFG90911.1 aspartate kinase [Bacillus spizizenii ATCC 6633 = JCM 2499]KFK77447.1 aspartate kinase domain protein [Bacillus spizizenii]